VKSFGTSLKNGLSLILKEYYFMRRFNDKYALTHDVQLGQRRLPESASFLMSALAVGMIVLAAATGATASEVKSRGVKIIDGCRDLNKNGKVDPYENWRLPVEERVEDLLSRMTLQEKIGQTAYPSLHMDRDKKEALNVLDGGVTTTVEHEVDNSAGFIMVHPMGSPRTCAEILNTIQVYAEGTRLGIPVIMGIDPHTHIYGGTRMNVGNRSMALSATDNCETIRKVYDVWRKEMRAVGIHLLLGPQTDLTTDPRGVRHPDTQGENAEWIYQMNQAITLGFQGAVLGKDSALLCPKHFPGVGCTGGGHDGHQTFLGRPKPPKGVITGTQLKSTKKSIKWHFMPFQGCIDQGTWAVMAPYYVFPEFLEGRHDKVRILLQEWLRGELGFKGVICTDWGAVTPYGDIQGGCSIARVRKEFDKWLKEKKTDEERINNSMRRILTGKFKLGLFENPYVDPARAETIVKCAEHRAIAKLAAQQCQVVLKNEGNLIPLPKDKKILWADAHAPEKCGELAKGHDIAVVSVRGYNGIDHRRYDGQDLIMFVEEDCKQRLRAIHKTGTPIVAIYHLRGNPFPMPWVAKNAAAIMVSHGAFWEGTKGVGHHDNAGAWMEVLMGNWEPTGKLQVQIPRSMAQVKAQREDLPFDLGCTEEEMQQIEDAIGRGESPPKRLGDPLFEYGITGWGPTKSKRSSK